VRDKLAIRVDVIFSDEDGEERDVERDVEETEEDERELVRNRLEDRAKVGFAEVCTEGHSQCQQKRLS
jgi:hypothetical protein